MKVKLEMVALVLSVLFSSCDTAPRTTDAADMDGVTRSSTGKSGVMMQGFYWDVPSGGNWYNTMKNAAAGLANMVGGYGIDVMWFPPPSKGESGPYSMGYDPYDYYDLGQYNQKGTTETRMGSQAELKAAIAAYKALGIACMADIVLNHRAGGAAEVNPYTGKTTYTNFTGVLSGKNKWTAKCFHPNTSCSSDPGIFSTYPDVCYVAGANAAGYPYADTKAWMIWLMSSSNAGFSQWRFDYVRGIYPWVVKDMKAATGNPFTVGEFWDSNVSLINTWIASANSSAFDFPLYTTMSTVISNSAGTGNLADLVNSSKSLAASNPSRAVTFCGNHDTDTITRDKMMAYAFILTYQGYPTIWWKDYFDYGLATSSGLWGNGIKQLVWCRGKLAAAAPSIELLKTNDGDCLIYGSKGTSAAAPGYLVAINDNPAAWKGYAVTTANSYLKGKTLKAYAWHSSVSGQNYAPGDQACSSTGSVSVWAPPRGYAVYSVTGF